jgi:CheY-like chemotaxis protein
VLLPVPDQADIDKSTQHAPPRLALAPRGVSEVVLLVEDQDDVRRLTRKVLERSGYVVLEANDGRAGLSIIVSHPDKIDVLVSDVVMPEMSGGALAKQALMLRPDLKVLFVSGHTEDAIVKGGVTQGAAFLQKPYTPADLARKVREVLDVGGGHAA